MYVYQALIEHNKDLFSEHSLSGLFEDTFPTSRSNGWRWLAVDIRAGLARAMMSGADQDHKQARKALEWVKSKLRDNYQQASDALVEEMPWDHQAAQRLLDLDLRTVARLTRIELRT